MSSGLADAGELLEMAAEEGDQGAVDDVVSELQRLQESLEKLEFRRMFSGEMDANNCYLDIQAGSGGTEAQDWANILLRMYLRWADQHGFDALRITHIPTNTVVSCQNQRSQHANKDHAMKMLRAKLYELEMMKRTEAAQALEDTKSDIGWGHQIRSYVLDQSRIKDLRTGIENSNCNAVLDGDLDEFIEASLKQGL